MSVVLRGKLDAARASIAKDKRFAPILSLLMQRDDVIDPNLPMPTACSDGVVHKWHPEYLEQNDLARLKITKLHELGHDWLYHTAGRGKDLQQRYGHMLTNMALDYAVNDFLRQCGLPIPDGWLCDEKFKGMSAEEIARELAKKAKKRKVPRGKGEDDEDGPVCEGEGGTPIEPDPDKDEEKDKDGKGGKEPKPYGGGGNHEMLESTPEQTEKAKKAIDKATADSEIMDAIQKTEGLEPQGNACGDGSVGSMMEAARAARHKAKDWRDELSMFVDGSDQGEKTSTYAKICKRPVEGVIRPGHKRNHKPHIGIILDTSGSMSSELPKLMVELEVMSQDGFSFDVVCTDGDVYGPYHFNDGEFDYKDLPLEGGGGSDMEPAFVEIKDKCPECEAIVFCTDGYIHWPDPELLATLPPTLLVLTEDCRSYNNVGDGFAKTITMEG